MSRAPWDEYRARVAAVLGARERNGDARVSYDSQPPAHGRILTLEEWVDAFVAACQRRFATPDDIPGFKDEAGRALFAELRHEIDGGQP